MSASPARQADSARLQRGSLLVEFMVVAALALALAVWGSHEWAERTRVLQAQALATWMESARDAVQAYLDQNAAGLAQQVGQPPPEGGLAAPQVPDWAELRQAGHLPPGWQAAGPLGQSLGVTILRASPCAPGACLLRALVHTQGALQRVSGRVDEGLIAEWLLAARGRGLVLWPHRPEVFSGAGERVSVADLGGTPWQPGMVGLLAARALTGGGGTVPEGPAADTENFLRVRDARNPDFQGDLTVQGVVRADSRMVLRESLVLEQGWSANTACAHENALARDQSYPGVLMCHQGRWRLLARGAGGGYLFNSRRGCRNATGAPTFNPYTGDCVCPNGFSILQISESGSITSPDGLTMGYLCVPS